MASSKKTMKASSNQDADPPSNLKKRVSRGTIILPKSVDELRGNLSFSSKAHKVRYKAILSKKFIPCKYIDTPSTRCLKIDDEVWQYVRNIGWLSYFDSLYPSYTSLCHEFYTTFEFNKLEPLTLSSPGVVKFRLMKKEFSFSITQFNVALGFTTEQDSTTEEYLLSTCEFSQNFNAFEAYRELSILKTYNPKTSKACFFRDAALKYLHRFLVFNFSGRHAGSSSVNFSELYFLWAMKKGIKVNLGYWLATQFMHVIRSKKKPLISGSCITKLAVQLGLLRAIPLTSPELHVACETLPLDLKCLAGMGLLTRFEGVLSIREAGDIDQFAIQESKDVLRKEERSWEFSSSEDDPPVSGSSSNPLHRIEEKLIRMEERQIKTEQTVLEIQRVLHAFIDQTKHLTGFVRPPSPST